MKTLVLGSGGREHAIAWSLEWSVGADKDDVYVAPGNAGSSQRLDVDPTDPRAVVALCRQHAIDLVVVGPESAVAAGVTDELRLAGIAVFGPSRTAGQLETSKAFCRAFADRHGIPSPASRVFVPGQAADARRWADAQSFEVVVKADGLASGKGVVVPETVAERDAAIDTLLERGPVVLEQRLYGDEVSLLVFTDGTTVRAMPPACDHKRIFDADLGPNTGGMGVFAPTQSCPPAMVSRIIDEIVQPAVDGMREEGSPFTGVLYAGVMITESGPYLIEFNCRFGDPEAQTLLPMLRTDLKDVLIACTNETLVDVRMEWGDDVACTVVMASRGYPAAPVTGDVITGLERAALHDGVWIFHAGTERSRTVDDSVLTAGGRVLNVTAVGRDLVEARRRAYGAVADIDFTGAQFRRDIGWRELARHTGGYAASGVNIDEGNRAVALMKEKVEATHGPHVLAGVGAFGGTMTLPTAALGLTDPVLVASTDGVGTKVMIATEMGCFDSIGHDIVNHCVDDILVQGARPLFFLDYVAASKLSAGMVAAVVGGMADACRASGCVLLGGETAEMPGVYAAGHFDIAGTIVGLADRAQLLPRADIGPGDVLIGVASSGLHTNGYSLVRRIFAGLPLDAVPPPLDIPLGEALLVPHRSYLPVLEPLLGTGLLKAMAHITGGGILENLPRVLPTGSAARVHLDAWPTPPLFRLIAEVSRLETHELYRTLNMGIGMVLVVSADDVCAVQSSIQEPTWVIGCVTAGDGAVELV